MLIQKAIIYYVFSLITGHKDDIIALDDIQIQDKPCDTAYLQIHDYSELLAATANKTSITTDPLYTDDGYAFRLIVCQWTYLLHKQS